MALFALMQFLSAPILGRLSDRYGRRPVFRVASIGTLLSLGLLFPVRQSLFLMNRFADGSTNGLYPVVKSAIVDVSEPHEVQRNVGLSTSLSYIGLGIGPAFAFLVLELAKWQEWNRVRALVVAGLIFAGINVFLSFLVPETRPSAHTPEMVATGTTGSMVKEALSDANPVRLFHRMVEIRRDFPMVALVLMTQSLVALSIGYYSYFVVFVSRGPLKVDAEHIALMFVYFSVLGLIVNTVFFGKIVQHIKILPTIRLLLAIGTIVCLLYGLLTYNSNVWMYVVLTLDMATFSLVPGLVEGLIGRLAPEETRGEFFGIGQGISSLSGVAGAALAAPLAYLDLRLPFLLFAVAAGFAFILSLRLRVPEYSDGPSES